MDAMFAFNTLIMVATIIYGVAFGISNWFTWVLSLFGGRYNQSNTGRMLDAAFFSICWIFLHFRLLIHRNNNS